MSDKNLSDEEHYLIFDLGLDSNGMKRKIFNEKDRKEKFCY